jgi:hypothetical protein
MPIKPTTLAVRKVKQTKFHWFENKDGALICVSAEHGDDAADYYGEFRGGYPWINPILEKIASDNGCFWEWMNPGAIALYEA